MKGFLDGGKEEEQRLLEILRSSDDIPEIQTACLSLARLGTIYSLPVLYARLADTTREMAAILRATIERIGAKHNVPEELWHDLSNPSYWRMKWAGTPESFLAFVEIFSLGMVAGPETGKTTDLLGEIFMKVIEVDLSPYKSFHELRICSTEENLLEFAQRITDHLESQVMVHELLDDVSIDFIRPEIDGDLYKSLQMDYFTTRLRQYVKFADE